MKTTHSAAAAAGALTLALTLGACGGDDMGGMDMGAGTSSSVAGAPPAAGSTTADSTEHNDADTMFAQMMIVHHRQAIAMADLAADRAVDPNVAALADRIRTAQQPEIDTMSGWLQAWGEEVPQGTDMGGMGDMGDMGGMDHGMDMPGAMSAEEMQELSGASGAAFDRLFLQQMIEHHNGAIEMARTEQADGQNADAVSLAGTIVADQTAEVQEMEQLLAAP